MPSCPDNLIWVSTNVPFFILQFLGVFLGSNVPVAIADTVKQRNQYVGQHLQRGTQVSVAGDYYTENIAKDASQI